LGDPEDPDGGRALWTVEDAASYFLAGEGLRGVEVQPHDHGPGNGTSTSVREFEHRGHRVRIETTYRITIDGAPLLGHVFPQYAPNSAVDVVKAVIDTLWEKPPVRDELADDDGPETPDHGPHGHGTGEQGEGDHDEDDGDNMDRHP
jgi:hypothetical protein